MTDKKVLLDAAALLVKLATGDSAPTDPKLATIIATWEKLLEQFENSNKPHDWVDWGPGVLPDQSGNNEPESPFYEKFKNFWKAMEREGVRDHTGKPFVQLHRTKDGGNKMFEDAVKYLAKTPEGRAWFNHPLNANYLPKAQDMLLLN